MDNFEIVFTEIVDTVGKIYKRIEVQPNGKFVKSTEANTYQGTAKTLRLSPEDFVEYLDGLSDRQDTCLVPAVWAEGLDWAEYDITLQGKEDPNKGLISRTKEFFKYLNSDSISLMCLDFDGDNLTKADIHRFVDKLRNLLGDSILGTTTNIMRFEKPSSSSRITLKGQPVNESKLHIYIPVRNMEEELLKDIFKWAWLNGYRGHLVSKAATVLPRSIIDQSVATPSRLFFEADPEISGSVELVDLVDRKTAYFPGGALDCELARAILATEISSFDKEWTQYKRSIEATPEIIEARAQFVALMATKLISQGTDKRKANSAAELVFSDHIILSSDSLLKSNGTSVSVYDILVDRHNYIGQTGFQDFIDPTPGTNKAMIVGDDSGVRLKSFAHGGIYYHLRFDAEGLNQWADDADDDELVNFTGLYAAQSVISGPTLDLFLNKVKGKIKGLTVTSLKNEVKIHTQSVNKAKADADISEGSGESIAWDVSPEATHNEITDDMLNFLGHDKCRYFGGKFYVADKSIWNFIRPEAIEETIASRYLHCKLCKRASDYRQIANFMVGKQRVYCEEWNSAYGIPCASRFLRVGPDVKGDVWGVGSEQTGAAWEDYHTDLGCRFKLKFNPDWNCETPYWNKVLENVQNKECFQQGFGLAIAGYLTRGAQMAMVLYGKGGTGKGTTNTVMSALLPGGKVTSLGIEAMSDAKQVMCLVESVVNFISEIRSTGKVQVTEGFKKATGGDLISGWELYKGTKQFRATASQIININDWPKLDSTGSDLERRLGHFIVEFEKNYEDRIEGLSQMIIAHELPGVLAWAIDGIISYFQTGIDNQYSLGLWGRWINSFDPIGMFFTECIEFDSTAKFKRSDLWTVFQRYCEESSFNPVAKGTLYDRVENMRVKAVLSGGEFWFSGIKATDFGREIASRVGISGSSVARKGRRR